jgi:hypothetical protein
MRQEKLASERRYKVVVVVNANPAPTPSVQALPLPIWDGSYQSNFQHQFRNLEVQASKSSSVDLGCAHSKFESVRSLA